MIFIIGASLIIVGAIVAIFRSDKPLKLIVAEAKYEIVYNVIGSKGLIEDFVMKKKNKTNLVTKTGKVAVITGGNRGIGMEVVRMLLQCDMDVVMGCRNPESGEKLLQQFRGEGVQSGTLKSYKLDISSLSSVRSFGKTIKENYTSIDYLINNAGIMYVPYAESEDGIESQFATNYLGHFLLTHLLLPLLRKAGRAEEKARIVNVTSCAYLSGNINFEDVNKKDFYISFEAYAQSKLAQLLFSNYLSKQLQKEEALVESYSVHPGIVNTELFDNTNVKVVFWWLLPYIFKNAIEGATPIVHTCLSPELENKGGTYVTNCRVQHQKAVGTDEEAQKKLFDLSLKMTNVGAFGLN